MITVGEWVRDPVEGCGSNFEICFWMSNYEESRNIRSYPTEKSHVRSHVISHLISHVRSHVKISREIFQ